MSFLEVVDARAKLPRNSPAHAVLGPLEHRKYVQGVVQENPLQAAPMALAIPAYTLAKALRLTNARSPASFDEMGQAYRGLWEGLTKP